MGAALIRPPLYAGAALAGVQLANMLRPVGLDANAAIGGAESALRELGRGNLRAAGTALLSTGKDAKGSVEAQIKANVVIGIVGGCLVAGLVDLVML